MKNIKLKSIEEWGNFKIGDLFKISRGKRILKEDYQISDGRFNVITAKTDNNGIDGKYHMSNAPANILTVCGEVSGMSTFFQAEETWVLDTARICIPKKSTKFNKNIALFLIPLFEKNKNRYGFGKKLKPKQLSETVIKLPKTSSNEPDWQYMEDYIKYLECNNITKIQDIKKRKINKNIKLKPIEEWNKFKVGNIFEIKNLKAHHLEQIIENTNGEKINYLSRTSENNGIVKKVQLVLNEYKINQKNQITITAEGIKAFYQGEKFISGNKVYSLRNNHLNKYNGLFVTTVLNYNILHIYNYSRARISEKIANEIIELPTTKNNEPDWQYMEEYIKSLPYSNKI